jgi:hypothetical protein
MRTTDAMELSRGKPRGPGDRRQTKDREESLDGKKSDKTGHARNYSSEIEDFPENEANLGNVVENELKHHEQREPARGRPSSVRTKRGF